jgi:hypothetical protein
MFGFLALGRRRSDSDGASVSSEREWLCSWAMIHGIFSCP